MLFETKIALLIRRLNPYTAGAIRATLSGTGPGDLTTLAAVGADISSLGTAISNYAAAGGQTPKNLTDIETAEEKLAADLGIDDILLRVDNDYNEWTFRLLPYKVKRSVRVTYRYALPQPPGSALPPIYADDELLIGFVGSNGG